MDDQVDAPPPIDADEPPPRRRGLGRGLADLKHAGLKQLPDGRWYAGANALWWSMEKAADKRIAERTPQPVALHRLPEPEHTGPIKVADVLAQQAASGPPATESPAELPKPRTLSESAAMLVRGLPGMSETLRAAERAPEPEPVAVAVTPASTPEAGPPAKKSKWAFLEDDDA